MIISALILIAAAGFFTGLLLGRLSRPQILPRSKSQEKSDPEFIEEYRNFLSYDGHEQS